MQQVEDGFRKRCVVKNISISLDKLTLEGKVDAYQGESNIFAGNPGVNIRVSLADGSPYQCRNPLVEVGFSLLCFIYSL